MKAYMERIRGYGRVHPHRRAVSNSSHTSISPSSIQSQNHIVTVVILRHEKNHRIQLALKHNYGLLNCLFLSDMLMHISLSSLLKCSYRLVYDPMRHLNQCSYHVVYTELKVGGSNIKVLVATMNTILQYSDKKDRSPSAQVAIPIQTLCRSLFFRRDIYIHLHRHTHYHYKYKSA